MPKAIDIHIHPPREPGRPEKRFTQAMARYFKSPPQLSLEELADKYRQLDMMAVVLATDDRSAQGIPGTATTGLPASPKDIPTPSLPSGP
ncbi:MAG: hypothetical protein V3U79_08410 [Dehalococcoidia bacterium]